MYPPPRTRSSRGKPPPGPPAAREGAEARPPARVAASVAASAAACSRSGLRCRRRSFSTSRPPSAFVGQSEGFPGCGCFFWGGSLHLEGGVTPSPRGRGPPWTPPPAHGGSSASASRRLRVLACSSLSSLSRVRVGRAAPGGRGRRAGDLCPLLISSSLVTHKTPRMFTSLDSPST